MIKTQLFTEDEKRLALARAIESKTFARSDQLRAFLQFICEAELRGSDAHITEAQIGMEALGRGKDYSPAGDSSVRTRAYELRHKLDKLYAFERTGDDVHIVLPKGTYTPKYQRFEIGLPHGKTENSEIAVANGTLNKPPSWVNDGARFPRTGFLVLLGTIAATALIAALLTIYLNARQGVDPVLKRAWGPLANPGVPVLLSVATIASWLVGPETHQIYATPLYPAPPETYPLFRQHRPLAPGARLSMKLTDNLLPVGVLNAVVIAARTLGMFGASYQILPERIATLPALRGRNAILFGAPVDSEAITRLLQSTPFSIEFEPSIKEFVVRDRSAGTFLAPKTDQNGDLSEVYGLITVLRSESDADRLATIVFSGITSVGVNGAAEFFSSPDSLKKLDGILRRDGMQSFPVSYQVVVKCSFSKNLLLSYAYHSHRIISKD